jgi:hypothetical protein
MKSAWKVAPVALVAAVYSVGCGQSLDIPIPFESPPQEISATEAVNDFESGLCDDPTSQNCLVLQAVDYSDDDQVSDPPSIPDEFPTSVTLVDPDTGTPIPDPATGEDQVIDVLDWLDETGASDNMDIKQAMDIDIRDQVAEAGITDPAQIEAISIGALALNWQENSLTFSTVDLDLYASTEEIADSSDPDQLIADGLVQKIGVIEAQSPETTGEQPIVFVTGGNEVLNTALRNFVFTLVVALPPGTELQLADGAAPNTKKKPTGDALVSVKTTVVYTIKTPDLPF